MSEDLLDFKHKAHTHLEKSHGYSFTFASEYTIKDLQEDFIIVRSHNHADIISSRMINNVPQARRAYFTVRRLPKGAP